MAEPLPAWTKEDLKTVVLHSNPISPPACKIRAILQYHKVPFTNIKGAKKDSEYKKVPVIILNDRQINDSYIIVKSLAPILYGAPLSAEDLAFEEHMAYKFLPILYANTFHDVASLTTLVK